MAESSTKKRESSWARALRVTPRIYVSSWTFPVAAVLWTAFITPLVLALFKHSHASAGTLTVGAISFAAGSALLAVLIFQIFAAPVRQRDEALTVLDELLKSIQVGQGREQQELRGALIQIQDDCERLIGRVGGDAAGAGAWQGEGFSTIGGGMDFIKGVPHLYRLAQWKGKGELYRRVAATYTAVSELSAIAEQYRARSRMDPDEQERVLLPTNGPDIIRKLREDLGILVTLLDKAIEDLDSNVTP